jgi:hypothetical protein
VRAPAPAAENLRRAADTGTMVSMRPWSRGRDPRARVAALALVVAALLAPACTTPAGLPAEQVCTAYCDCEAPLPQEHARCTASCEQSLTMTQIPDACFECLDEPLCTRVEACIRACAPPSPTSLEGHP